MANDKKDERGKKRKDVKMEFIISPVPQEPVKKISEAQQVQLDIIAKTNFNFFNGRKIAEWLKDKREIYEKLDFMNFFWDFDFNIIYFIIWVFESN